MQEEVLEQVDRERIVEMACNLANIVSITGEEENVAKYLGSEFEKLGMQVEYQYVEDGRPNVVGTLKGTGGGATLMFNAHMDHFDAPQETVVDDDRIYGRGLVNMKAAFPCYIEAVSAMQKAGTKLKGDLIISGVVGEIEKAQIGRFHGKEYRGAGVGARYLMDHGVMADMCIIGEPTGLATANRQLGVCSGRGSASTARRRSSCSRPARWRKRFKIGRRNTSAKIPTSSCCRQCRSAPSMAAIAFKPGTRPTTDIFVIVKMLPGAVPLAIKRDIEAGVRACAQTGARYSRYSRRSLSDHARLRNFQERTFGESDGAARIGRYSASRCPMRNRSVTGSPATVRASPNTACRSITYGPGFGTHLVDPTETKAGEEWDSPTGVRRGVGISNMVNCTKVYAMAALDICNRKKEEVAKS